ncbi:MAG: hypothetical protein ACYC26_05015 [Phycisphaerales bacterium]
MASNLVKSDILVRFTGGGVKPELLPTGILHRSIAAIQRLALLQEDVTDEELAEEGTTESIEPTDEDQGFRLVKVVRASAGYQFATPRRDEAVKNLRLVGEFLERPTEIDVGDIPINAIKVLSHAAKAMNCEIEISVPANKRDVLARFQPRSYSRVSSSILVTGNTSLTGQLVRVGGATAQRCAMRLPTQSRLVFARIEGTEIAQQLGQWLYQDVTVTGYATWVRTTPWRVLQFVVLEIDGPKKRSYLDVLQEAAKLGHQRWNSITDPDEYLSEVTGSR